MRDLSNLNGGLEFSPIGFNTSMIFRNRQISSTLGTDPYNFSAWAVISTLCIRDGFTLKKELETDYIGAIKEILAIINHKNFSVRPTHTTTAKAIATIRRWLEWRISRPAEMLAFEATIREDPDNTLHVRAYADYLEEEGYLDYAMIYRFLYDHNLKIAFRREDSIPQSCWGYYLVNISTERLHNIQFGLRNINSTPTYPYKNIYCGVWCEESIGIELMRPCAQKQLEKGETTFLNKNSVTCGDCGKRIYFENIRCYECGKSICLKCYALVDDVSESNKDRCGACCEQRKE